MEKIRDNRTFRISINVFCGVAMTALYIVAAVYLLARQSPEISNSWCALLLCMFACTWLWVYLASTRPHPYLRKQKEMAKAVTVTVIGVSAALALGISLIEGTTSDLRMSVGWVLIASSLALIPWMLRKIDMI